MNIAVINAKDLFKYILKFFVIITIIILLIKGLKSITNLKQKDVIKETIETTTKQINQYSFLNCLDLSMSLISYKKEKNINNEKISSKKILAMGAGIFDESIYKNTDLIINEEELTIDDTEELVNQIAEIPDDVTTEAVSENNISPKVTTSYGSVQINNQSDYELTEDILKPDVEITNKKDILIYHTHTCESYTASKRI
ncbi:MAG: hypothetical protein IJB90_02625 [Clostridia bacterium]|nr:hypothetical protein [Clostridia bacterium]